MTNITTGMIVKVLGFVGVVMSIETEGAALYITVDSPKRIALHQTSLDRLDYNLLPSAWQPSTPVELLKEFSQWFAIQATP
jgi:hypothetical protein